MAKVINIITSNKKGYVVDWGEDCTAMPRFAVWEYGQGRKAEVVFATNDEGEARAFLTGEVCE